MDSIRGLREIGASDDSRAYGWSTRRLETSGIRWRELQERQGWGWRRPGVRMCGV